MQHNKHVFEKSNKGISLRQLTQTYWDVSLLWNRGVGENEGVGIVLSKIGNVANSTTPKDKLYPLVYRLRDNIVNNKR